MSLPEKLNKFPPTKQNIWNIKPNQSPYITFYIHEGNTEDIH